MTYPQQSSSSPHLKRSVRQIRQKIARLRRYLALVRLVNPVIVIALIALAITVEVDYADNQVYYSEYHHFYDATKYIIATDVAQDIAAINSPFDSFNATYDIAGCIPRSSMLALANAFNRSIADEAVIGEARLLDGHIVRVLISRDMVHELLNGNFSQSNVFYITNHIPWYSPAIGFGGFFHSISVQLLQIGTRLFGWPMLLSAAVIFVSCLIMAVILAAVGDGQEDRIRRRIQQLEDELPQRKPLL